MKGEKQIPTKRNRSIRAAHGGPEDEFSVGPQDRCANYAPEITYLDLFQMHIQLSPRYVMENEIIDNIPY